MKADIGTLSSLIESGRALRLILGSSCRNVGAFQERLDSMGTSEIVRFLAALDSIQMNTRVLELAEIEVTTKAVQERTCQSTRSL